MINVGSLLLLDRRSRNAMARRVGPALLPLLLLLPLSIRGCGAFQTPSLHININYALKTVPPCFNGAVPTCRLRLRRRGSLLSARMRDTFEDASIPERRRRRRRFKGQSQRSEQAADDDNTSASPKRIFQSISRGAVLDLDNHEHDPSARKARIVAPLSALSLALGAAATATTISPSSAYAADDINGSNLAALLSANKYLSSVSKYFASSLPVSLISDRVVSVLQSRGYTSTNTALLSSLCSDEDNDAEGTILGEIRRKLVPGGSGSDVVKLGALAGLPLYATSAFDTVLGQRTEGGSGSSSSRRGKKIFIVYGPHIGIGADGSVGKKGTGACGTALGAYSVVAEEQEAGRKEDGSSTGNKRETDSDDQGGNKPFDVLSLVTTPGPQKDTLREVQEDYVIDELRKRLSEDDMANPDQNSVVRVVMETMYGMINELVTKELDSAVARVGLWEGEDDDFEIVMLGGIIVRGSGGGSEDLFEPLAFTSLQPRSPTNRYKAKKENLLPMLFGGKYNAFENQEISQRATEVETKEKDVLELRRLEEERIAASVEAEQKAEHQRRLAADESQRRAVAELKAKQELLDEEEATRKLQSGRKVEPTPAATKKGTSIFANIASTILAATIGGVSVSALLSQNDNKPKTLDDPKETRPSPPRRPSSNHDTSKPNWKVPTLSKGEGKDPLFSTSSKYRTGFPESYLDKVDEACDPDEAAAVVEDCAPAVKEYFDAVSKGTESPAPEGSKVIAGYIDALSSDKVRRQARVISPSSSGPAVESYLTQLSTGEVRPPPSSTVKSYLSSISSGEVHVPRTVNDINTMMYSILETMKPPKLQTIEEVCDPDEPKTAVEDCGEAVKDYLDAVSEGSEDVEPEAPAVIGSYIDALSSSNENVAPGKGRDASPATSRPAVASYLTELSTGSLRPPPSTGVTSYLDAVSSGETSIPKSATDINSMMGSPPPAGRTNLPATGGAYLDAIGQVSRAPETGISSTTLVYPSQATKAPRSYSDTICQECNIDAPSESCVAAISSYLDALAMGAVEQDREANSAIASHIELLTGTSCRSAVLDYLDEMTSAEKPPSAAALLSYLEGLANRRISPPTTSSPMSLYLNW